MPLQIHGKINVRNQEFLSDRSDIKNPWPCGRRSIRYITLPDPRLFYIPCREHSIIQWRFIGSLSRIIAMAYCRPRKVFKVLVPSYSQPVAERKSRPRNGHGCEYIKHFIEPSKKICHIKMLSPTALEMPFSLSFFSQKYVNCESFFFNSYTGRKMVIKIYGTTSGITDMKDISLKVENIWLYNVMNHFIEI